MVEIEIDFRRANTDTVCSMQYFNFVEITPTFLLINNEEMNRTLRLRSDFNDCNNNDGLGNNSKNKTFVYFETG